MLTRTLRVRGQALWTPDADSRRATPTLLATNERRRAPDSVLMALQVAEAACAMAAVDPGSVASVFTSAHGDLAIVDALCRTLATDPLLLSPMRFHHSVHNAASGYWAIGCGSHEASTALSAHGRSFATGLLEAACQCAADDRPVLLVGYDTEACGPLASVNHSRGLLAVALVLAPQRSGTSLWQCGWAMQAGPEAPEPLRSAAARSLASNAMADALPLFEALAAGRPGSLALAVSAGQQLQLSLTPLCSAPGKPGAA